MALLKRIPFSVYLVLLWIGAILVINPIGEFPLNDDWAYARSVFDLVEKGELVMVNWPAMTLVAQIYWGALFCKIFGASFTVLRFSTLVSSLIGALAFYKLANELSVNKKLAAFATLLLFFNPMYFLLSYTFMTDVHFLSFFLLAFLFFTKNIRSPKPFYLILATLFSVIATLIRQPGLLIPFVFMLIGIIRGQKKLKNISLQATPFLITLMAFMAYSLWLKWGTGTPNNVQSANALVTSILSNSLNYYFYRAVSVLLYVGLFLLPFLFGFLRVQKKDYSRRKIKRLFLGISFVVFLYLGSLFFPIGNIFYNLGLGPKLLKDGYLGQNIAPQLSQGVWLGIKYISVLATALWLLVLSGKTAYLKKVFSAGPLQEQRWHRAALFLVLIIFGTFLIISPYFFDRYTLPLIACSLLYVLPYKKDLPRWSWMAGGTVLLLFGLFSLTATHHYLSWNKTRWEAVDFLREEWNISPDHMDAGFEVNAWYQAGPIHEETKYGKSWWFVTEDDYVLSFGPLAGFKQKKVLPVKGYWPFHQDSIHILWHMVDGLTLYSDYPIFCGAEQLSEDGKFYLSTVPQVKFDMHQTQSDKKVHTGKYAVELSGGKEFGFSTLLKDIKAGDQFSIRVWRWDESRTAGIVLSADSGEKFYHFETQNIIKEKPDGWQLLELKATIPNEIDFSQVGISVWNPVKKEVWFDDLEINRLPVQK